MSVDFDRELEKKKKLQQFYKPKSGYIKDGLTIKDVDMTKRIVTGFFNTSLFFDSDNDVLMPGAAKKSLSERGPDSPGDTAKIKHLKDHNMGLLVARPHVLDEREIDGVKGIYFESKMPTTTLGTDTLINYQSKIIDNHSIGFRYMNLSLHEEGEDEFDKIVATLINPEVAIEKGFLWAIKEINLFEGSAVAFGANSLTPFLGVKGQSKEAMAMKILERIDAFESSIRGGKQSDDMLKDIELQSLQLKQIISELVDLQPSEKDTFRKGKPSDSDTKDESAYTLYTKTRLGL